MSLTTSLSMSVIAMTKAHNGKLDKADALQAELLASPEVSHVMLGGRRRPFLLSFDGFERAAANGHDPLPALYRLVTALGPSLSSVDAADEGAIKQAVAGGLNSKLLPDVAAVLYAGFVSFERTLTFESFKAGLTIGAVVSIVTQALPKIVAFLGDLSDTEGEAEADGADHASGDSGN